MVRHSRSLTLMPSRSAIAWLTARLCALRVLVACSIAAMISARFADGLDTRFSPLAFVILLSKILNDRMILRNTGARVERPVDPTSRCAAVDIDRRFGRGC